MTVYTKEGAFEMKSEHIVFDEEKDIWMDAYILPVGGKFPNIKKRPFVFIIPGGGYNHVSPREGDPVAFRFLAAGFSCFILNYGVNEDAVWPKPLNDYERAAGYIMNHAAEWDLDTENFALCGFSAGAHLAGCAAAVSKYRPKAAILGYPVASEENVRKWSSTAPSMIELIDEKMPPCFIFGNRTDETVPVEGTIKIATALEKYGIGFELHVYSWGPHGFSTGDSSVVQVENKNNIRSAHWVEEATAWLKEELIDFADPSVFQR